MVCTGCKAWWGKRVSNRYCRTGKPECIWHESWFEGRQELDRWNDWRTSTSECQDQHLWTHRGIKSCQNWTVAGKSILLEKAHIGREWKQIVLEGCCQIEAAFRKWEAYKPGNSLIQIVFSKSQSVSNRECGGEVPQWIQENWLVGFETD